MAYEMTLTVQFCLSYDSVKLYFLSLLTLTSACSIGPFMLHDFQCVVNVARKRLLVACRDLDITFFSFKLSGFRDILEV